MKNTEYFRNKKILILGLGKSGFSSLHLLESLGSDLTVNDSKRNQPEKIQDFLDEKEIPHVFGEHPKELVREDLDFVLKSPGIPYDNEILIEAENKGIPIYTDVELLEILGESPLIGITGTNGKSTTTALLGQILNEGRSKGEAIISGNIGIPVLDAVREAGPEDDFIVELSSFQLKGTYKLKPDIAVITNLYSAHLDYHETREDYVESKMKITQNQRAEDYLIYNYDSIELRDLIKESKAKTIGFSTEEVLDEGVYLDGDDIFVGEEFIMSSKDIKMPGKHNIENALAAIAVAKVKEWPNEDIIKTLKEFSGIPHRLQYVGKYKGRTFFNDSKATNALASAKACYSFEEPVVLLAGGLDRHESFSPLSEALEDKVKALVTFGETKKKIYDFAKNEGFENVSSADTMREAVTQALSLSESGDVILLSPACASWDSYKNFEERGHDFIDNVNCLIENQGVSE